MSYKEMADCLSSNEKAVGMKMTRLFEKCRRIAKEEKILKFMWYFPIGTYIDIDSRFQRRIISMTDEKKMKAVNRLDDEELEKVSGGARNEADLSGYKGSWMRFVDEVLGSEDPIPPGLWGTDQDPYRDIREY